MRIDDWATSRCKWFVRLMMILYFFGPLMGYYWGGAKLNVDTCVFHVMTAVFVLIRLIAQKTDGTYDSESIWFNRFWFTAIAVISVGTSVYTLLSLEGGPFSSCETSPYGKDLYLQCSHAEAYDENVTCSCRLCSDQSTTFYMMVLPSIAMLPIAIVHRYATNEMWDGTEILFSLLHSASMGMVFAINAQAAFVSATCKSDHRAWLLVRSFVACVAIFSSEIGRLVEQVALAMN